MTFDQPAAAPPPASPKAPDPVRIPMPDDPDLVAARRRKLQEFMTEREGRRETTMSGGGREYSRTTLG